ncbi:ATP-binding cassette domain-containing protein [Effusibacillus dendaii]|uniref:ABC transporter domain-containing protein n=1 Tax=Effusibacillus dendaii TaxID=2743772 RepID=A0A7I8DCV5_9BACL|nr:ATP-binding cassette domain-containing protein [Effusibacillus dendaii]BCJ86779.1 hypothetical protein skT53_17640 [Effusibacillus dendaii]
MRVTLTNVGVRYGQEPILQEVNLQIETGSLTVVCGLTGSGKSTLLQVIGGLELPASGSVQFDGDASSKREIGFVFQNPDHQLFAGTVCEEIEYGLRLRNIPQKQRQRLIDAALRQVRLEPEDFLQRSPFLLSGGEKKRVALAAALAPMPQLLLLDEPTAGLDPSAQRGLLEILRELSELGITVVVATHDLDAFFPLADQVAVLYNGKLAFAGRPDSLVEQPAILQDAGLVLPTAARIGWQLRNHGMNVKISLQIEELLDSLDSVAGTDTALKKSLPCLPSENGNPLANSVESGVRAESGDRQDRERRSLLHRLDPRVKWLGMVVLSLAGIQMANLSVLTLSYAVLCALFAVSDMPIRKIGRSIRPFLPLFLFLWAVSAVSLGDSDISFGWFGLSYQGMASGGYGVARFLYVICLGILFAGTTGGLALREGFEWAIRPLQKIGLPTRDLSLAVSIALQFVPLILIKISQLRKSLHVRMPQGSRFKRLAPRQMGMLVTALLILMLKMGDELATAIESRGYKRNVERTSGKPLIWRRGDTVACGVIAIISAAVWLLS